MTHPYGAPSSLHYENGKKQKTSALNNKKGEKAKSTQKKQKHTYLITDGRTFLTGGNIPSTISVAKLFSKMVLLKSPFIILLFPFI